MGFGCWLFPMVHQEILHLRRNHWWRSVLQNTRIISTKLTGWLQTSFPKLMYSYIVTAKVTCSEKHYFWNFNTEKRITITCAKDNISSVWMCKDVWSKPQVQHTLRNFIMCYPHWWKSQILMILNMVLIICASIQASRTVIPKHLWWCTSPRWFPHQPRDASMHSVVCSLVQLAPSWSVASWDPTTSLARKTTCTLHQSKGISWNCG